MEVLNGLGDHDHGGLSEESRDLDFKDVFGGPPRRFLMQNAQAKYSFGKRVGPEEDGPGLSLWGLTKEKAIFGEESVGRRRHLSDDFYDDIFRGNESYGSLRRIDRDRDWNNLFGSSPGSRIVSRARALCPRTEPFGASHPAQFRFSNQVIGHQEVLKHNVQPAYHRSSSSHESSFSHEDSQYHVQYLKRDTKSVDRKGNEFHFSIYKWAGGGVPAITPLVNRNSCKSKYDPICELTSSNGTMKVGCEKKDSRNGESIKVQPNQYCADEVVFDVLDSNPDPDEEENVAFEVNSLPEFLIDEVVRPGIITEMKGKDNITPKEAYSDASRNVEKNEGTAKKMIQDNQVEEAQDYSHKAAYSSGSIEWDSKTSVENPDDPFEDNFLVQELSDDLEEVGESIEPSEDMKALDAKIRQWSSGKKGNIRSLLSTLQYVLWSGSGWKAMALVDLIEANSVKRAYQKALLCLHPDKLQQRGAPSHHNYIAQKVFDILQEAWDHFNTLATLTFLDQK